MRSGLDKPKTANAAGQKIARLISTMPAKGQEYCEQRDRQHGLRVLTQRLAKLGMQMIPI